MIDRNKSHIDTIRWKSMLLSFLLVVLTWKVESIYEWSFQSRVKVPSAGSTYAQTPSFIIGRGFQTLITGYDGGSDPGIYVHTNDDGYVVNHQNLWSQQAKLAPGPPFTAKDSDGFGTWMVADQRTLIVSSPYAGDRRGFAFIFNGTLRHWSFIQRLQAVEVQSGDLFGERMYLQGNTVAISAKGTESNGGVVYIFQRVGTSVFWSRQGKLIPRDIAPNQNFGQTVALYGNTVVVGAKNDDYPGTQTGSAYVFASSRGLWSQQQKLIALEMQNYYRNDRQFLSALDLSIENRFLGPSLTITKNLDIIMGTRNVNPQRNQTIENSVYIFTSKEGSGRWSIQQKLFHPNDTNIRTTTTHIYSSSVYSDQQNTLLATTRGPNATITYVFKSFGGAWSLQSQLMAFNPATDGYYYNNNPLDPRPGYRNFSNPTIWGGTLLFAAGNEVQIRNHYHNNSCLLIWMSDHFKDGWDTAVLTVRAPDLTNDTFHPHCDQVDPFLVRYCPYQPTDEGVYIVKVFAATEARFYWEIVWQVTNEATGEVYRGDFSTKLMFNFNATTSSFSLVYSENLLDIDAPCYTCTRIARQSWTQLQIVGNSAFWPLTVSGAPYFISDYQGRFLGSSGKVCNNTLTSQCYQTLVDGIYILRLGAGPFGDQLGFPRNDSSWEGCGDRGGHLDQFVFMIKDGLCTKIQKYHYSSRCARPPPINSYVYSETFAPTFGGTVAPSESVFGEPYVKGQMYDIKGKKLDRDIVSEMISEEAVEKNELTAATTSSLSAEDNNDRKSSRSKQARDENLDDIHERHAASIIF